MRKYCKKRRKLISGKLAAILIIAGIVIVVIVFFNVNVNPVLKTVSEEQVRALTTVAVNKAADDIMNANVRIEDILQITKDSDGEIKLIQINTATVNSIARKTVLTAQDNITAIGEQGIAVPLGSLSGLTFLAGRGPNVKIKVFPVGSISSDFFSEFSATGINQSRHRLTMKVFSAVNVVIPGVNKTVNTVTEVILCENIIIGKVPDTYLQSSSIGDMLDLVPR